MAVIDFVAAARYGNKLCAGSIFDEIFDGGSLHESVI